MTDGWHRFVVAVEVTVRFSPLVVATTFSIACLASGWVAGCASTLSSTDSFENGPLDGAPGTGSDSAVDPKLCPLCVTDQDCNGGVCAQFGSDIYCAPACPHGNECTADRACTTVSSAMGAQVDVCVPRGDACGTSVGPGDGGSTSGDGSTSQGLDSGTAPPPNTCGTLDGPTVTSNCNSCGTHTCQANGCYGGWWCDTATKRCQAAPTNCTQPPPPSQDAGTINIDAGGPVSGSIGSNGGKVSRLLFGVIGDTRPPAINDTSGYPTAVITKIFQDVASLSPMPLFVVSTGDYMFASSTGTASGPQLDMYLAAQHNYPGIQFPTMGNHECTGAVTSNCGAGTTDGLTNNYQAFMSKLLGPLGKTTPYYEIDIDASDNSWTAKFLFVAANAWTTAQASWLQTAMARPTTYTFIVRHEPSAASSPGTGPSEQIMGQYPYTLALVGHTHTYGKTGARQVTIGNGGAPLTGSGNYGFGLVSQRTDGTIQIDMIDYSTGQPDTSFRFALHPDGSPAP